MDNAPAISNLDKMISAAENIRRNPTQVGGFGGRDLLKLDKLGNWVIGQECTPLTEGNIVVLPTSFEHGIILWENFKLIDEHMVSLSEDLPVPDQTQYPNSVWAKQYSFHCNILGTDQQLLYKTSSMGGREFAEAIIIAWWQQAKQDPSRPVPEIELSCSSYVGKSGKVFKPGFQIVDWHSMDGDEPSKLEEAPAPEQTARIRTRTRRA